MRLIIIRRLRGAYGSQAPPKIEVRWVTVAEARNRGQRCVRNNAGNETALCWTGKAAALMLVCGRDKHGDLLLSNRTKTAG